MEIKRDTSVEDLLIRYPSLSKTFIEIGLPCQVCGQAFWGTIEELAQQNNVDPANLVKKLNKKRHEIDEKI
jgi:hypothetical protein